MADYLLFHIKSKYLFYIIIYSVRKCNDYLCSTSFFTVMMPSDETEMYLFSLVVLYVTFVIELTFSSGILNFFPIFAVPELSEREGFKEVGRIVDVRSFKNCSGAFSS